MKIIELSKTKQKIEIDSKDASEIFIIGFDGGELDFKVNLTRPEDNVNVYGVIFADKDKEYKINTISNHLALSTKSRLHIKAIASDSSRIDFTGMINIELTAQLADAYLKNDNLIISENAKVNSSPQLEIKADDVKASHGVSISHINEEELLYIKSRGLPEVTARNMIVYGFINDLLKKLDQKKYKKFNSKVIKLFS